MERKHGGIIINQLHKLGCSCDWDRERFTMDEEYTKAVGQVFIELFKEGLIYRGRRMVNWCPVSLTALSDEEVIMTEQKSKLYTVLYKLEDGSGALHVATTRPEPSWRTWLWPSTRRILGTPTSSGKRHAPAQSHPHSYHRR